MEKLIFYQFIGFLDFSINSKLCLLFFRDCLLDSKTTKT